MTERISEPGTALEQHFARRVPLERWGTTEEIASTVCFLMSDSAGYVTGVDLLVDGGMCQSEPPGCAPIPSPRCGPQPLRACRWHHRLTGVCLLPAHLSHRIGDMLKAGL